MTVPPYPTQGDPYGQPQQPPYGPANPYGAPDPYGSPQPPAPSPPDPFYRGPVAGQPVGGTTYGGYGAGPAAAPGAGQPGYGQMGYVQPGYGGQSADPYAQQAYGYPLQTQPYAPQPYPYTRPTYELPVVATTIGGEPALNQPWYGIGFLAATKRGFQKYATFRGRASRGEFWWFYLAYALAGNLLIALFLATGGWDALMSPYSYYYSAEPTLESFGVGAVFYIAAIILSLACMIPLLALTWRRLHDSGKSGAWFAITLVPFGSIVLLVFLCQGPSPTGSFYDQPGALRSY